MLSLGSSWVRGILLCFCLLTADAHTAEEGGNTLDSLDGLPVRDATRTRSGPEQGPSDLGERGRHEAKRGSGAFLYNRKTSRADAGISPPTSSFSQPAGPAPLPIEDVPTDTPGRKEVSPERRGGLTVSKKGLGRHRTRATLERVKVIALFTTVVASLFLLRYIRKCILGRREGSNSTAFLGGSGVSRRLAAGGEDDKDPCKPPPSPKKSQPKDEEERLDVIVLRIPGSRPLGGGASSSKKDTPSGARGERQTTRGGEEAGGTHTASSSSASPGALPAELQAILLEMLRVAREQQRHASQSGAAGPPHRPAPGDHHRPRPGAPHQPGRAPSQQRTSADPYGRPSAHGHPRPPSHSPQPSRVRFPHPGPHVEPPVEPSAPPLPPEEPATHRVPGGMRHGYFGSDQPRQPFPPPQPGHPHHHPTGPRPPPPPYPGPPSAYHPPGAAPLSHGPGAVAFPDPRRPGPPPSQHPGHSPLRHPPGPAHRPAVPGSLAQPSAPSVTDSIDPSLFRQALLGMIDQALETSSGRDTSSREGPGGGSSEEAAWLGLLLQRLENHNLVHGPGTPRPGGEEPRPPGDQARGPPGTSGTRGPPGGSAVGPGPRPPSGMPSRGPADVPAGHPEPSAPPLTASVDPALYRELLVEMIDETVHGRGDESPSVGSEARLRELLLQLEMVDQGIPFLGSGSRGEPATGPGATGHGVGAAGYERNEPEETSDIFDEEGQPYDFTLSSPPQALMTAGWAPGVTGVPGLRDPRGQTTGQREQRAQKKEPGVPPIPESVRGPERTPSPSGADATAGALQSLPEDEDEGGSLDWSLLVEHGIDPQILIQSMDPVSEDEED